MGISPAQKGWYARNRERLLVRMREYYQKNKARLNAQKKIYVKANAKQRLETLKRYNDKCRLAVIEKLGGACARCGFSDARALQIDHINGGGSKERKSICTSNIVLRILKHGPQDKYQLLCANCNWIKRVENKEYRKVA